MRAFFTLLGCPICNIAEECILEINKSLPIGKKIEIIDVFSGDTRLAWLAGLYKTEDIYEWKVPVLVLDNDVVHQRFNSIAHTMKENLHIHSIFDKEHYIEFVERYLR